MGIFDSLLGKEDKTREEEMDASQDEKEIVALIKERLEESKMGTSRTSNESIWMTNIAYVLGYDSIYFDGATKTYRNVDAPNRGLKQSRVRTNLILSTLQIRQAKLLKTPPKYDTKPQSTSPDDKDAARLGMQVLDDVFIRQNIEEKRQDRTMWQQQCGHAYMKVSFDPTLGKLMVDPMTGQQAFEGEVRVDVVSPFEIYPDPLAKSFDDLEWVIQAKARKLNYFKMRYPEKGKLVKEEGPWLLSVQYESKVNTMNNKQSGTQADQMKNAAIELVMYQKRTPERPNGRMVVVAGDVVLEDKELPYGHIPLVKYDDIKIGGKYYPESIVTHLRPLQDQYNRNLRKRADWTNKLLAGKYVAPRGSNLIDEALNDRSGEVTYFDPIPNGGEPRPLQIPSIPEYTYKETDNLKRDIYDMGGISDISRGQLPSASIPAAGMQMLVEADDSRIAPNVRQNEIADSRLGFLILECVQKTYTTERLLKISGPNMEYTVKSFKGSDLNGNTDVYVVPGSSLPGSKVLKRQELLNLFSQGLLGNPQDPVVIQKLLSWLEYGEISDVWTDLALDAQNIQQAIESIEQGVMPIANLYDNHDMYMQKLNQYRKTDKFQALAPEQQAMVLELIDMHADMKAELLAGPPPAEPVAATSDDNLEDVPQNIDEQLLQGSV